MLRRPRNRTLSGGMGSSFWQSSGRSGYLIEGWPYRGLAERLHEPRSQDGGVVRSSSVTVLDRFMRAVSVTCLAIVFGPAVVFRGRNAVRVRGEAESDNPR